MKDQLATRIEHELDSRSVGIAAWISAEVAIIPQRSTIGAVDGLTGLGLVAACALPGLRRHTQVGPEGRNEPTGPERIGTAGGSEDLDGR